MGDNYYCPHCKRVTLHSTTSAGQLFCLRCEQINETIIDVDVERPRLEVKR